MEIAGSRCKVCKRTIVFADEGKYCVRCGTVVHLACESRAQCAVCGQPCELYEPPKADPMSQAIIPPALRSGRSGGPVFAIGAVVVLAALVLIVYYALQYAWAHGH
jgi:hypothetical protein